MLKIAFEQAIKPSLPFKITFICLDQGITYISKISQYEMMENRAQRSTAVMLQYYFNPVYAISHLQVLAEGILAPASKK
jgi:hypothetical protein